MAEHVSVLLNESIEQLKIRPDGVYLDGTLGLGGHSEAIVQRLSTGMLIGIDRDETAISRAGERLRGYGDRARLVHGSFATLGEILDELSIPAVDGMIFDLGVSSPELSRIFSVYGEERYARRISAAIVRKREQQPINTTLELADVIRSAMPAAALREKQHPAKRCFQAIRIEVNDELGEVERMMQAAPDRLKPGGRLCVISFHSLEDRIVKQAIAAREHGCTCPREAPVCTCGFRQTLKTITRKPILPKTYETENTAYAAGDYLHDRGSGDGDPWHQL